MSKCEQSENGLHTFTFTPASREPHITNYMTCIACGERRAIGIMGDLLVRSEGQWMKLEPGDHGYIKTNKEKTD